MKFKPTFEVIDTIDALPLGSALKGETMLYQASVDFAYDKGGPITKQFISKLPTRVSGNVIVDVRVHHLQAGYYPAIPGYHLDWMPRINKGADPDMSVIPDYEHVVMILAETSLTEFLDEPLEINLPAHGAFEYANDHIKSHNLKTWHVENGQMVHFTSHDWHRPSPAQKTEWRMLLRASRVDHVRPANDIRTTAQVYIPFKEASW